VCVGVCVCECRSVCVGGGREFACFLLSFFKVETTALGGPCGLPCHLCTKDVYPAFPSCSCVRPSEVGQGFWGPCGV
jgi:hypothetical protein